MLYLIGLGFDEQEISLKALDIAKNCECLAEIFTSRWEGSLKNLEAIIGKPIKTLKRSDLEENLKNLIENAKDNNIALFVPGDPLVATTHIDIILELKKQKIPFKIIHNASIFSAIGETGLQIYKFGKTATIPFTEKLENVKDAMKNNKKLGLHTLLLLDIEHDVGLYMTGADGIKILLKNKLITKNTKLIMARIPGEIYYKNAKDLLEKTISPAVLIIPGKLHFKEKEFLDSL